MNADNGKLWGHIGDSNEPHLTRNPDSLASPIPRILGGTYYLKRECRMEGQDDQEFSCPINRKHIGQFIKYFS